MTKKSTTQLAQTMAEQMEVSATTTLANGWIITAQRKDGVFTWLVNGNTVGVAEAQNAMLNDPADAWPFVEANTGIAFEMKRPTYHEQVVAAQNAEIAEHNAKVEEKKRAKKERKLDKIRTLQDELEQLSIEVDPYDLD
jgi:hypothetical protein